MTTTLPTRHRPGARREIVALLSTDASSHPIVVTLLTVLGAAGMVVSGLIHLHLYAIAYRHIATIGPLFLVQGISSMVLALAALVCRRVFSALLGAGAMVATLAGFLISVNYGLFGFQDSFAGANAIGAFVIEIVSAALLLAAAALSVTAPTAHPAAAGGTAPL